MSDLPHPDAEIERALVVMAHPDDVDFGAAGTVCGWTAAGIHVTYCLVTDGQAGGFDPSISRTDMAQMRRREQTAAAALVGVTDLHFLGYIDGSVQMSQDLRRDISRVIRQVKPQRMLIQSPDRNYARIGISHPDHLAAGATALAAIYPDARNPFAHPELLHDEGLEPWSVPETWLMGSPTPNHWVDITEHLDTKFAAIESHATQLPEPGAMRERLTQALAMQAAAAGLPEGHYAEAFQVIDTR